MIHAQMAQHGRGDIDQRGRAALAPWGEPATLGDEERVLLVAPEPAMLAKADLAFGVIGIGLGWLSLRIFWRLATTLERMGMRATP